MEKDKGIFSFGKHPVGEFFRMEKRRKSKRGGRLRGANARVMRRAMSIMLAAVLIVGALPVGGLVVSASGGEKGLCEHHTEHTADAAGTVDVNITAVASVEKDGTTSYVDMNGLNTVFAFGSGYDGATVTLLDDVTITEVENCPRIDILCTLNLNGHTIRTDISYAQALVVTCNGNVTITGSGEVVSNSDAALYVAGTAVLEGGTFCGGGAYHGGVEVVGGSLSVTGEKVVMENTGVGGRGLLIYSLYEGDEVRLSAGKYSGGAEAISVPEGSNLSSLLNQEGTSRVAYYKDNSTLVTEGLDGLSLPSGSYTVRVCTHTGEGVCTYTHIENTFTHKKTCLACGQTWDKEACSYGNGYTYDEVNHTQTCELCGYEKTEAHNWIYTYPGFSGGIAIVSKSCRECSCKQEAGTITSVKNFSIPFGETKEMKVIFNVPELTVSYLSWKLDNTYLTPYDGINYTCQTEVLDVGTYLYNFQILASDAKGCVKNFDDIITVTITPAPLTEDMVTLSAESVIYNGTEQKPALSVKHGQTALTEGTDYVVSCIRDGAVTTDLTSAGTVTVTITGKGNYKGEVMKTFTIKKAKPSLSVEKAEITYGEALYESVLTAKAQDDNRKEIAGTFTWKDRFVKPAVADSGKTEYTVVFTPDDEANYDSVETKVKLTVEKAENPPKKPGSTMNVSVNCDKVSDIVLPEGWEWQDSDRDNALTSGAAITATAEYIGTDKENYKNITAEIEITRSECSHIPGDFMYTEEGEKAPACTKEGLGHRECTVCHVVMESGAAVPALGHDYTETVTKAPTTEQEGVKTFKCSRCNDTYTEPIPKLTGGGSASGGGSTGGGSASGGGSVGGGTAAAPEATYTFTETVTKINSAGKKVVVTTTIKYGKDKSIISKTVKSVIEHADKNTAVTVTVKTDNDGKSTAVAAVARTKTAAEKETENIIFAAVVSQIIEAAGTEDVMITWKIKDADGKIKYTVTVNAGNLKKGRVLKIMKTDPKTGEYVLVNAKNYPVTEDGNVSVTMGKKGVCILLNEADAKKYSDAIKKSIKVKESSKSVKAGQKTLISLDGKTNKKNIKKITYTSTGKSTASVDKKGGITAKEKGSVIIKAKVTLKNGVTKTVKMKVKVR